MAFILFSDSLLNTTYNLVHTQIYYMKKISDLSLLFSIILFIIDELVKGINIREVVVRMRSSLHVRQQTIAHGKCFGVGGCFRHWGGY